MADLSSSSLRSVPGRAPPASAAPGRADSPAASPHRGRRAGRPAGARTQGGELAFPDRLGEERRVHLLHRARLAVRTGGPLASVLLDPLLLAEAPPALGAPLFVDRHGGMNVFRAQTGVKLTERGAISD